MKAYNPIDLEVCSFKGCPLTAEKIIHRTIGDHIRKDILLSYCDFHAALASGLFGDSNRSELRGVSPFYVSNIIPDGGNLDA